MYLAMPTKFRPSSTTTAPARDDPRRKLMQAATEVFAEVGYQAATVREICARAGHNVAAVNYHFGDKYGLYTEILKDEVLSYSEAIPASLLEQLPPEEALRVFVQNVFRHIASTDKPAWHTRVMMHEMAVPTEGLGAVVELVIRPKLKTLAGIVGRFLGVPPTHPKARLCVHSIMGQLVHYAHGRPTLALLWPDWKLDAAELEVIANHIVDFSITAMKAVKRELTKAPAKSVKPE